MHFRHNCDCSENFIDDFIFLSFIFSNISEGYYKRFNATSKSALFVKRFSIAHKCRKALSLNFYFEFDGANTKQILHESDDHSNGILKKTVEQVSSRTRQHVGYLLLIDWSWHWCKRLQQLSRVLWFTSIYCIKTVFLRHSSNLNVGHLL